MKHDKLNINETINGNEIAQVKWTVKWSSSSSINEQHINMYMPGKWSDDIINEAGRGNYCYYYY